MTSNHGLYSWARKNEAVKCGGYRYELCGQTDWVKFSTYLTESVCLEGYLASGKHEKKYIQIYPKQGNKILVEESIKYMVIYVCPLVPLIADILSHLLGKIMKPFITHLTLEQLT